METATTVVSRHFVTAMLSGFKHWHVRNYDVTVLVNGTVVFRKANGHSGNRREHVFVLADMNFVEKNERHAGKRMDQDRRILELVPKNGGGGGVITYWEDDEERDEFRAALFPLPGDRTKKQRHQRNFLLHEEAVRLRGAIDERDLQGHFVHTGPAAVRFRELKREAKEKKKELRQVRPRYSPIFSAPPHF